MTNELQETWPIEKFPAHEVVTLERWFELNANLVETIVDSRLIDKFWERIGYEFEDLMIDEVGIESPREGDGDEALDVKMNIVTELLIRSFKARFDL